MATTPHVIGVGLPIPLQEAESLFLLHAVCRGCGYGYMPGC